MEYSTKGVELITQTQQLIGNELSMMEVQGTIVAFYLENDAEITLDFDAMQLDIAGLQIYGKDNRLYWALCGLASHYNFKVMDCMTSKEAFEFEKRRKEREQQ
jgi:hypothetical protein